MILFSDLTDAETRELNELILSEYKATGYDESEILAGDRCEDAFQSVAHHFPSWLLVEEPGRCRQVPLELVVMAKDGYRHRLTNLQKYVLQRAIEDWVDLAGAEIRMVSPAAPNQKEREDLYARLAYFASSTFASEEFAQIEELASSVFKTVGAIQRAKARKCVPYLELVPKDLRAEILDLADDKGG